MEELNGFLLNRQVRSIADAQNAKLNFSVFQWNTLAKCLTSSKSFPHVPAEYLDFNYRKNLISQEIKKASADIICLEEVDDRDLEFFKSIYKEEEYSLSFAKKPQARDGIIIMMKKPMFEVIEIETIVHTKEDATKKENLASHLVVAKHKSQDFEAYFIVAACHFKCGRSDEAIATRVRQASQIMEAIEKRRQNFIDSVGVSKDNIVTIVCGDLNDAPEQPSVAEFLKNKDTGFKGASFDDPFTLCQKYGPRDYVLKVVVDHIFYSKNTILTKKLSPAVEGAIGEQGLLGDTYPSDHLSLFAEFSFVENKPIKESNSIIWKSFIKYYPLGGLIDLSKLVK